MTMISRSFVSAEEGHAVAEHGAPPPKSGGMEPFSEVGAGLLLPSPVGYGEAMKWLPRDPDVTNLAFVLGLALFITPRSNSILRSISAAHESDACAVPRQLSLDQIE